MSDLLEKAKRHFNQLVDSEGTHCIEVPEWGEDNQPAKLYFKPLAALPIKTYSRLVALGSEQTVEAFVDMLILRCLDSEGQPVFKRVDKTEMLREISPVVVCQIIKAMSEQDSLPHCRGHEKKLIQDPPLFFLYQLAERLHKTVGEIREMPVAEWLGWLAYVEGQQEK